MAAVPASGSSFRRPSARTPGIGLRDYLSGLVASLPERPKAFLVVTAHWEAAEPTVSVNPKPGMLYRLLRLPRAHL